MTRDNRTAFSAVLAAYGVLVIVANLRNGILPTELTTDWVLFGGGAFPGEFGRNVFGGSVALGVLIVVLAVAMWVLAGRRPALLVGSLAIVLAVLLLVLYDADGNLLAARPAPAAVIAAAGLLLIASALGAGTKAAAGHDAR
ncbi:hypothetical protein BH20ACT5_BH20ACT5_13460 [soil metagenome]